MRDLASLVCKTEMLPCDEWGPMTDSYDNKTGPEFDELMDQLAAATTNEDTTQLRRFYDDHLSVPTSMIT